MTVDELQVLITANTEQLRKEIKKTQDDISGLSKQATKSTNNLTKTFIKAGIFTKTLGLALKSVTGNLDSAITRLDTLNNYTKVMSNLGVSGDDAEASIQRLSDKLEGLPTTLDDAVGSVQRFTSANGNVKASTEMFLALNNAILSGGANMQIQSSALEQLSQAYTKGRPDMMEWRTAMMAMPAQLKQVAQAMGYVNADKLGEDLRSGKVSMNEFMATIMKLNKEGVNGFQSFEQQAKNSTGGVRTSMINVKTAITKGLTEIMNAIGQSNIAGFFHGISSAINKTIPYITGFVKACVWAVGMIASLFGVKTKKNIDNTKASLSSLGSSGVSTSKDLDKTTSSAKNLGKALNGLASFDEMNVLTENSGSSDSGDSGVGNVNTDLGDLGFDDWDTNMDKISNKSDEIANKIKSAFLDIGKGINFNNLITSFNNLKTSLEPITATLFSGLEWAYHNILVPLTQWTIGDLIPSFLNALSGALTLLNPILSSFQVLGIWLWDSFLQPISTWTGSLIVDTLNGVGGALTVIGEWASANQGTIDTMVASFATFFGLWKLTQLLAFIQMSGGLIGAITGITGALIASTTAKIADKAETAILTAMYAKDFLVSIVTGTSALIKQIAQWSILTGLKIADAVQTGIVTVAQTLWNTCASIGSVVTGVLATAFAILTSPITLVILGIGALVTAGVLLWKNWDTVTSKAKELWLNIQSIFTKIGNFIGNIFSGIENTCKKGVNFIIDGLNTFIGGLNKIKVPDWVPAVGGKGINIPKIPRLAQGGVIDEATLAVVGEAGKEAVMPLENNTGWMDILAERIASRRGSTGSPIQLIINLGEETIFEKFIDYMEDKDFQNNGEVFDL